MANGVTSKKAGHHQFLIAFLLPSLLTVWQLLSADKEIALVSALPFSDAALFHYSAWYQATFDSDSFVTDIISLSPYESVLSHWLALWGNSNFSPFLLNSILSGLSCTLITLSTRLAFDRRAAWFAIALYGCSTPILFFAGLTVKTHWVILLASASSLLATLFLKSKRNYLVVAFTFLVLVASIDRIHMLCAIMVMITILLLNAKHHLEERRSYLLSASVILMSCLGAYALSSAHYGSEPKYVSNVGLNIYFGHSKPDNFLLKERGIRNNIIGHRTDATTLAEEAVGRRLRQSEVTQFWLTKTLSYIRDNPTLYVKGQLQKLHHLFAAQTNSFTGERPEVWHWQRWPLKLTVVDFGLTLSLFIVGCLCILRQRRPSQTDVYLMSFSVLYLLSLMATLVVTRYRMVALVSMIPVAAVGLSEVIRRLQRRDKQSILALAIGLFSVTQVLAYTAPAEIKQRQEKNLALEQRALKPAIREFYVARAVFEKERSEKACYNFVKSLKRIRFAFDVERSLGHCHDLKLGADNDR